MSRNIIKNNINVEFKQDYISINHKTAISAEGVIFKIGDKVKHEGDSSNNIGTINTFSINHDTLDVIAHTQYGQGRICFLYHLKK